MAMGIGFSVDWVAVESGAHARVAHEVWVDLADSPDWAEWLAAHYDWDHVFSVVIFEDRAKPSLVLRGTDLSYRVPAELLYEAVAAGRERAFFAVVFRDVYVKWADKLGAPAPPELDSSC